MNIVTIFDIKVDFIKSHNSYVFDKNTQEEYLDFFSLYSSLPLGYSHEIFDKDFLSEVTSVAHLKMTNNVFQTDELQSFIAKFINNAISDYVHFCSTGALAIESAIKCSMEYRKAINPMVLGLEKSFHGVNSWGFVTDRYGATGERMKYFPKNNWQNLSIEKIFEYIESNDLSNLVAVIVEPVQCTSGDIYIDPFLLKKLQKLCNDKDICFIVDEIQTGFGTSGSMWYSEKIGLRPDILVFGKKAQISGIMVNQKYSELILSKLQKLDVTFDGDLIDAIRAKYILYAYEKYDLISKAVENSNKFRKILEGKVLNYRSSGHLIAFDFNTKVERNDFLKLCYKNKLLCNSAGETSVRLRPNMAINEEEIKDFEKIINKII
ncbi:MAG: aminotransferase class III-fold pyridoxal phosphate-dependent enzyme [Ignavibacteriales bacterium]|nr:aminotransferase class III-fold pyridoxal phosphate-dependent enzyme [Ignavibacteriales bacterium]